MASRQRERNTRGTILLVDHDGNLHEELYGAFRPAGYEVLHVDTAEQAFEECLEREPVCVLHALTLRPSDDHSGSVRAALSSIRAIRDRFELIPIVVLRPSRTWAHAAERQALRCGGDLSVRALDIEGIVSATRRVVGRVSRRVAS